MFCHSGYLAKQCEHESREESPTLKHKDNEWDSKDAVKPKTGFFWKCSICQEQAKDKSDLVQPIDVPDYSKYEVEKKKYDLP